MYLNNIQYIREEFLWLQPHQCEGQIKKQQQQDRKLECSNKLKGGW